MVGLLALPLLLSSLALESPAYEVTPGFDWAAEGLGLAQQHAVAANEISISDLLDLRDLGGLSVSPDGQWLAFAIRQADVKQNRYTMRWFVARADGKSTPLAVGPSDGGQPIPLYTYGMPQAYIPPERAQWSLDGSRIAFRRKVDDRVELWVVEVATRNAQRIHTGEPRVTEFAWGDPNVLIFRTGLNHERFKANLASEARHGWLLDSRTPLFAARAEPTEPDCAVPDSDDACEVQVLVYAAGVLREAEPDEAELLDPSRSQLSFGSAQRGGAARSDGAVVHAAVVEGEVQTAAKPLRQLRSSGDGGESCTGSSCFGFNFGEMGWARSDKSVWFLRSEDDETGPLGLLADRKTLNEWVPGQTEVRQVWSTMDHIEDCHVRDETAFCIREGPTRPRHVASINLDTGSVSTVVDPNPTWTDRPVPRIERRRYQAADGNPSFGLLVYPSHYDASRRYPLVIVTYRATGFLRGGVGDEYPILPLSAAGFFVLVLDRADDYIARRTVDWVELNRRNSRTLTDRQRIHEVTGHAIDELFDQGLIDPDNVAITGFSAGAESLHYSLQHTERFAAAIASSGNHDLSFFAIIPEGPARTFFMDAFGSDTIIPGDDSLLREIAWSLRPERLSTPLLINAGEREVMIGFEGIQAILHEGRPVEVRVFPDESHFKFHPQSIAGTYENNMMWLRFWLKGEEEISPSFERQYERWRAMRERNTASSSD